MLSAQTILSFLELPRVGRKTAWKLVELAVREGLADRDLEDFSGCRDFIAQASEVVSRVSVPDKVETQNAIAQASRIIEELDSYNDEQEDSRVELIGYCDEAYPSRLKDLAEDAPVVLFCRGDRAALDPAQAIAVIGTRNPSDKATEAAHRVGELLAREQIVVVSGLALGCDTVVHQGCVAAGGVGVAVLAHGLDQIQPPSNRGLADELLENGGCLVSEYRIGEENQRYNYVQRDRLQSGLSDAILVIETGEKGGTWHTVGFCQEQGRALGCLEFSDPGHQELDSYKGNRKLLSEEGAVVIRGEDLDLVELIRKSKEPAEDAADSPYRQGNLFG